MVFDFAEGSAEQKALLGGKGANLAEMTRMGFPVPRGFTISSEACREYLKNKNEFPDELWNDVLKKVAALEQKTGKKFGDATNPLLVSVRSGAAVSMPGMMDTVLNLGLNFETVTALANKSGNERFAWDSFRRFIQMFSDVVLGLPHSEFEAALERVKLQFGKKQDTELTATEWKEVVKVYLDWVSESYGRPFPENPLEQLEASVRAVFGSWNNAHAIKYREIHEIAHDMGTAVNVQEMVFGNLGETSGTGVAFTRNPSTGEKKFFGEFLCNAQGEDVVAGIRTPQEIAELEKAMPQVYKELMTLQDKLEQHFHDMQDIEFTIEEGKLFMLQARNGKRTAHAAVRIAVEMVGEKLITKEEAVLRVNPKSLDQLLHPQISPQAAKNILATGLPASPGAVSGKVVFSADDAESWTKRGEKVILVRKETSPEDVHGMHVAEGILTQTGGMTSHAAVVARGMGKCCVSGVSSIMVDAQKKKFTVGNISVNEGDVLSLDGNNGEVLLGEVEKIPAEIHGEFGTLLQWADELRSLKIRANADTPLDAERAREFGAEGIGLCRTEHMFFEPDRIEAMREMILAENETDRRKALEKLLPLQRQDFIGIFTAMDGFPVTIRFLDPPLHEFLPQREEDLKALAKILGKSFDEVTHRTASLHEINPMLGHRGCRLMVTFPEVLEMQTRAILEAALGMTKQGKKVLPELMIPLVGKTEEIIFLKKILLTTAEKVFAEQGQKIAFTVGTMMEVPRACTVADKIAAEADFFSFGTNDLTQMTFGFSRDDASKFLPAYKEMGILEKDPFASIDEEGVGSLVTMAVQGGRSVKPDLKIGVCGEHGGDPDSIHFFQRAGLNYVSCSPFRVPIARLSAAQAKLKSSQ